MSSVYSPVPGSQKVGKAQKSGELKTRKWKASAAPPLPSFPPFLCSRLLNSARPTISEPRTGYVSTVYAHCIFVVIGSLLLNIRLQSILNNRKKKEVSEEEKSSSTVGVFVILDNVSSSPSWSPEKPLRRLVHNRRSSVQTYCYFNQLISNHLKDFILDDIQTINFLPSRLYYDSVQIAITRKCVINIRLRAVSSFSFETLHNGSTREGRAAKPRETRESHNLSSFFAPLSSPRLALRKNGQPFTVYIR